MTIVDFLYEAKRLGFQGVQLCENFNLLDLNKKKLFNIKEIADNLGLFIEIGMNDLTENNLFKHMRIAKTLSSNLLRVVISRNTFNNIQNIEYLQESSFDLLKKVIPKCKKYNVYIGIENHFDLPTKKLVNLVSRIKNEHIGLIFDTTNHLAFIEKPEDALKLFMPNLISVHIKDYLVQKVEAGYLISGTILGEGRLGIRKILNKIFYSNKLFSIILEMTIKRKTGQNISEVVNWERKAVEKSAYYLNSICDDFKNSYEKFQ